MCDAGLGLVILSNALVLIMSKRWKSVRKCRFTDTVGVIFLLTCGGGGF